MVNHIIFKEFLRQHIGRYALGIVLVIVSSVLELSIPKLIGHIIDSLRNATATQSQLFWWTGGILAIAAAMFVVRLSWRYLLIGGAMKLECVLRERFFRHLQTLPLQFYNNRKTGELMAYAINDLQAIRRAFAAGLIWLLRGFSLNLISVVIMARTINFRLTMLALIPIVCSTIVVLFLRPLIRRRFRVVQDKFADVSDKVQENLSGIRVIKSYVQEAAEIAKLSDASQDRMNAHMDYIRVSALYDPAVRLFFGISFTLNLFLGSAYVVNGVITLGDFIAFNAYIAMLTAPVMDIGRVVVRWQNAAASIRRLDKVMTVESDIVDETVGRTHPPAPSLAKRGGENGRNVVNPSGPNQFEDDEEVWKRENGRNVVNPSCPPSLCKMREASRREASGVSSRRFRGDIRIQRLNFTYPDERVPALHNVNLHLKSGKTLALVGDTGSGKTTLVNLLVRLFRVERGHMFIDGVDINDIPLAVLRENVGYAPQDNFLFSTSIKENIASFKDAYEDEAIVDATRVSQVYDNIVDLPDGFDTVLGERGITLSGGQKQRISLARAIIKDPAILILDDSFSAVDTETEEYILQNLQSILEERTAIIIAHRISTVKYADEIVVLEHGRIIERGPHDELLGRKGKYHEMYLAQLTEEIGR